MIEKNNLIIIYGKAGTYKSSLGVSLLNSSIKNCCYIDLEGNKHIPTNNNITIYDDNKNINNNFIVDCINNYDVILIDYIELLNYKIEDIIKLKEIVKSLNKTLILISCCSGSKSLFNDNYDNLKNITDLVILTDK